MRRFFYFYIWFCDRENSWNKLERNNKELRRARSSNSSDYLPSYAEWRREQNSKFFKEKIQKNYRKDTINSCFENGTEFINTFIKMVALELKQPPQEIAKWELIDIINISSDIISRKDLETFEMFCNTPQKK